MYLRIKRDSRIRRQTQTTDLAQKSVCIFFSDVDGRCARETLFVTAAVALCAAFAHTDIPSPSGGGRAARCPGVSTTTQISNPAAAAAEN